MRTWFAKVLDDKPDTASVSPSATTEPEPTTRSEKRTRRLIDAPLVAAESSATPTGGIRIKAQLEANDNRIILMVDRPVLKGYSYWCAHKTEADRHSPLAAALFEAEPLASVVIHEMNVTVTTGNAGPAIDDETAHRLGKVVRSHLEAGHPAMSDAYLASMPTEEEVREGLQEVIENEINPGIAAHSGTITLTAVKGNTAYIKMGGGCQGCAASSITLRQGVETSFRNAVPLLGALLDETDHTAGRNPFFTDLPAGMRA